MNGWLTIGIFFVCLIVLLISIANDIRKEMEFDVSLINYENMEKVTVTKEQVQENMQDVIVRTLQDFEKPCTYVTVRMKNGFTLRESTTCVDPANYDEEIGKQICLEKIEDKVWFLLGYALQEKVFNTPKDYKDRMRIEYRDLQERTGKLCNFIDSQAYDSLPVNKRDLLKQQYYAMVEYLKILGKRCEVEGIL